MSEINGYNMNSVPPDYVSRTSMFTLWIRFWSCNLNLDRNKVVTFCSQECQGGALWSWPVKGWNWTSHRGDGCEHHMFFTAGQKVKRTHHPTWTDCPCQLLKYSRLRLKDCWAAAAAKNHFLALGLQSTGHTLSGAKDSWGTELPDNTDVSLQWG